MSNPMMFQCNLNGNVIDIQKNSTRSGALLDAFPSKASLSLVGSASLASNQTWKVLRDPAGSSHFIIQNPATGHCIDISENSISRGAALDAYHTKNSDNQNQLWDFLPDEFGSGSYFIQNPQTGYVIEIADGSSAHGAALVVNPRRLFGNNHQLWSAIEVADGGSSSRVDLPSLTLAPAPSGFGSNKQYVLLAPNQSTNLTSVVVTIDIIEDLIADSFSIQINGTAPAPKDGSGARLDAQWMQYALLMQNNSLQLWNQVWHARGSDQPGDPLASEAATSAAMLSLTNNTVPAGTQIVLTLIIDSSNDDFVTSVSGQVYNNGVPIGAFVNLSVIGQPTFNPGGPVQESDLAPFGALSVVVVGPPSGNTNFSSGMGTITVTCNPEVTVSSQVNGINPHGIRTAEESNCYYGQVQQGSFKQIVQPFGLPSPEITSDGSPLGFAGTGLLPNSKLTAKVTFLQKGVTVPATLVGHPDELHSLHDGSFTLLVQMPDKILDYLPSLLTITVIDADENWVTGLIDTNGDLASSDPAPPTSTGGVRNYQ